MKENGISKAIVLDKGGTALGVVAGTCGDATLQILAGVALVTAEHDAVLKFNNARASCVPADMQDGYALCRIGGVGKGLHSSVLGKILF